MILYFGNKKFGSMNPTTVDLLAPAFAERYEVVSASDKPNMLLRMLDMIMTLLKYSRRAQLVLIDTYSTKAFWFAFVIGRLCKALGLRYVPILHGGNLPARLAGSPAAAKALFGHAFYNISPSVYLKKEFEKRGYKVFYIPNSIPVEQYPYKERIEATPRLLNVRSFDKIYNIPMSVRVLHELTRPYPSAELCIVGPDKDGSLAEVQQLIKELGIEKNIRITGRLSKQDWHKLSEEYDIFISTTNFDNMPVSVIEAMALGLPVVSTNAGGIPYLLEQGQTGMVVPVKDQNAMTKAIRQLLSSPELVRQLSINGRRKAETFDVNIVMRQWFSFLDQALSHKKGPFHPQSIPEYTRENSLDQ